MPKRITYSFSTTALCEASDFLLALCSHFWFNRCRKRVCTPIKMTWHKNASYFWHLTPILIDCHICPKKCIKFDKKNLLRQNYYFFCWNLNKFARIADYAGWSDNTGFFSTDRKFFKRLDIHFKAEPHRACRECGWTCQVQIANIDAAFPAVTHPHTATMQLCFYFSDRNRCATHDNKLHRPDL